MITRLRPSPRPNLPVLLLSLAAALALAACAGTRVDPPPPVVPAAQYKEAGSWQHVLAEAPVPDDWWLLFQDPVLDDLQHRLVIGNENLRAAVARVASARATYEASRSAAQPTLSAGLSATRSASPEATTAPGARNPGNNLSLSASASWETDLWGRLAQASAAAQASLQASADDLSAARLSAQALLAQTYFSLRTTEAQLVLLERGVAAYQRSLELTQARYDGGVALRSDVLQAQTQLKSAQAQRADTRAQRAQLEHAIAVLLGVAPSIFGIAPGAAPPAVPAVPPMLPATLLERRPDIAAAQRRVAAAYAQIGVADAAFFPDLTLSASAGFRHTSLASLVSAPHLLWSLGPSLTQALFDGGQRQQASAQARASAEQATASYRQTVLTALQEVEDNLVLADQLQQEAQLQGEALQAAQRNLEITLDQYRAGTVSYLGVVAAQSAALASESSLLAVRNRQLAAINQLLKNIAGRWDRV
jgi:NodT family efflux transporter outer membrane factor (OMF) lipoprotein